MSTQERTGEPSNNRKSLYQAARKQDFQPESAGLIEVFHQSGKREFSCPAVHCRTLHTSFSSNAMMDGEVYYQRSFQRDAGTHWGGVHARLFDAQFASGYDQSLNFASAFVDLGDLCVPEIPFHRQFLTVSHAAMNLYSLMRDEHGSFGCE